MKDVIRRFFAFFWKKQVVVVQLTPSPPAPPLPPPPSPPLPVEEKPRAAYRRASDDELAARRKRRAIQNKIADVSDDVLTRFQNLGLKSLMHKLDVRSKIKVQELLGCDFYLLDPDLLEDEDEHGVLTSSADEQARAIFPMDYAAITRKDGYYHMSRMVGPISPSEVRGRARIVPATLAKLYGGELQDDGTWWAEETLLGVVNGKWVNLEAGLVRQKHVAGGVVEVAIRSDLESRTEIHNTATMLCAMALSARYNWHVALGDGDEQSPRLLLPTSPVGCLTMFRDREKETNETRRGALRHWVRNHYREKSETELSYVRDHLRGKTNFKWRDLHGEIFVSQYDLEKNEFFKQQAAEWRSARKHNRVKIKLKKHGGS